MEPAAPAYYVSRDGVTKEYVRAGRATARRLRRHPTAAELRSLGETPTCTATLLGEEGPVVVADALPQEERAVGRRVEPRLEVAPVREARAAVVRVDRERVAQHAQTLVALVEEERRHARLVKGVAILGEVHPQKHLGEPRRRRRPDAVRQVGVGPRAADVQPRLGEGEAVRRRRRAEVVRDQRERR